MLQTFLQRYKPVNALNFSALYGNNGQFQILHPILDINNIRFESNDQFCKPDLKLIVAESPTNTSIRPTQLLFSTLSQNKDEVLDQYFNKKRAILPDDFLSFPPFINAWGKSYAYVLANHGGPPYNTKQWVEKHLSYFKISELLEITTKYNITDKIYSIISGLTESEVEEVVRGSPLILSKDYLLAKHETRYGFSPLSYWVYQLSDLHSFLKESRYEVTPWTKDSLCLLKIGNVCWTYNSKHLMAHLYRYSIVLQALAGILFLILTGMFISRLYKKQKEQQRNRLALQVLSHEFRTPTSALLLMTEQLTKNANGLSAKTQDLVTKISAEACKLQRVIEVSKVYLQAESNKVHFKFIEIDSINDWISDFIEELNPNIKCQYLEGDCKFQADPFWLKFILTNLVQNALAHGKPPVWVKLKNHNGKLTITVEDHGKCEFNSLNEMTEAFVKSHKSQGMGLGLNIIKFILESWGTQLQYSKYPTAFTLFLRQPRGT